MHLLILSNFRAHQLFGIISLDTLIEGTELVDTDAPETIGTSFRGAVLLVFPHSNFGTLDQAQFDDILDEENKQDEADAFELHELQKDYPSGSSGPFHSHCPPLLSKI